VSYLDDLKEVIYRTHGAKATHRESVPVKETWQGKTVWEGVVEVFDLHDHPEANTAYAWGHDTEQGSKRHVAVLHVPPVVSPITAVRAAIVQELRDAQTA